MTLDPRRMGALVLLAALSGCQTSPGASMPGGSWALDRADEPPATSVVPSGTATFPTPPAAPSPAAAGPSHGPTGSGRSASGPAGLAGRVLDVADRPIQGATVRSSDGRQAVSGPDGTFTLGGSFPADGAFVASRAGYAASAIAGLDAGAPLTLHLQPQADVSEEATIQPDRSFELRGRVADSAGHPVEGEIVTIADSRGASAVPVETDAAGWFSLTVVAPFPRLVNATLLAAGPGGMAAVSGINAAPSAPFLDFDGSDAAVSPLVLEPNAQTVAIAVDGSPSGLQAYRTVELSTPDGVQLSLDVRGSTFSWTPQSGLKATLRVLADDADHGVASELRRELAPTDTSVTETLLAPPAFVGTPALSPGETIRWLESPGASGYQLALQGSSAGGAVWEGFTPATQAPLSLPVPLAAGPYTFSLTAWHADGLSPRSVASVGARALRILPVGASYKRATRTLYLTRP